MKKTIVRIIGASMLASGVAHAADTDPELWSIHRALEQSLLKAPALQAATAEIEARRAIAEASGNWPNPSVEISIDDSISLEQNGSGYDLTGIAITQPVPTGRLAAAQKQAALILEAALAGHRYSVLDTEQVAQAAYFALQYQQTMLELARQRHDSLQAVITPDNDPLVRYLPAIEKQRLGILQQQAQQTIAAAEGEHREAASSFRALLDLPADIVVVAEPLGPVPAPAGLDSLIEIQAAHPLLQSLRENTAAAEAGIEVSRAERRADPEFKLFTTRDVFAGREQTSTGIAVNLEVPLWNQGNSKLASARTELSKQQASLVQQQRQLKAGLRKSHLHLNHLIEQEDHFRNKILKPAQQILKLQRRGFRSGEIDLLNFIDAHNTYYDAREKHAMLMYAGWLELAELRYSAGILVSEATQ